jgi:hypothetical protein
MLIQLVLLEKTSTQLRASIRRKQEICTLQIWSSLFLTDSLFVQQLYILVEVVENSFLELLREFERFATEKWIF